MIKTADCIIIGGGVIGTAIAYYLAKKGMKNIILYEKEYLSAGATGRCGGGIRQQWTTEANVKLAMRSVELFEKFEEELGQPFDYLQKGYLIPAFTDEQVETFKKNVKMQKRLGLNVKFITPSAIKELAPLLNSADLLGATFCPSDGRGNPFLTTKGYAEKAEELGVEIFSYKPVEAIKTLGTRVKSVKTKDGWIDTEIIINAAGDAAGEIGKMAGLDLPLVPYRHQILVTEPTESILDPMVIDFHHGFYGSQVKHGSFIMGEGDPDEKPGINFKSNWKFLESIKEKFIYLFPALKDLRIVRQWSGSYTMTPDAQPIIGESKEISGFYNAVGYSGHGYMLAPASGEVIAEIIIDGKPSKINIDHLNIKRFEDENLKTEHNVV